MHKLKVENKNLTKSVDCNESFLLQVMTCLYNVFLLSIVNATQSEFFDTIVGIQDFYFFLNRFFNPDISFLFVPLRLISKSFFLNNVFTLKCRYLFAFILAWNVFIELFTGRLQINHKDLQICCPNKTVFMKINHVHL